MFSYQWLANGADVAGATSDTYTPVADDVDKAIMVKVSFRDDRTHQIPDQRGDGGGDGGGG